MELNIGDKIVLRKDLVEKVSYRELYTQNQGTDF